MQKAIIFDGRAFAKKKETLLKKKVADLKSKGVKPKLAVIITGEDEASFMYVNMKKKVAARVGIELEIFEIKRGIGVNQVIRLVKALNIDDEFQGLMVQMPLKPDIRYAREKIVKTIAHQKDVDGLWGSFMGRDRNVQNWFRKNQLFIHATSRAVMEIIKEAEKKLGKKESAIVIGASGMVGRPTHLRLRNLGYRTQSATNLHRGILRMRGSVSDILVSATGRPGIITPAMVKEGGIVIDVGEPKPDIDFDGIVKKAAFITPVPGGVGPVTVVSLLENLIEAAYNTL